MLRGSTAGYYWLTLNSPVVRAPPSPPHDTPPAPPNSVNNNGNNSNNSNSLQSKKHSFQLVGAGSGPAASSNLSVPQGVTNLKDDDPPFHVNYQGWQIGGDFEPGNAWYSADKSSLTLSDQTCSTPYMSALENCGPYWEWNGDNHEKT